MFQKFSSKISSNYESEQFLSHLAEESGRTSPLYDESLDVEMSEPSQVEADFGFFESTTQMPEIDRLIGNEEYVNQCIKRARNYFNQESGNSEAKRTQLSDYQNTIVETPAIIRQSITNIDHFGIIDKSKVMVSGHVKALVPLCREILKAEALPDNEQAFKYLRGAQI